jgi:hypothetical protein
MSWAKIYGNLERIDEPNEEDYKLQKESGPAPERCHCGHLKLEHLANDKDPTHDVNGGQCALCKCTQYTWKEFVEVKK